jgi:hypothetical protein
VRRDLDVSIIVLVSFITTDEIAGQSGFKENQSC